MSRKKAMVIGVDGGTWTALKPYIEEGTMPNLGRLLEEGTHGVLRSVIPPITAPAWTTFATGVNPGRHGCYYFLTMNAFGEFRPVNSADIRVETFYETLVRNGYKCTLINLPVSYPARIERTVITSLLSVGDGIFYPRGLVDEIPLLKEYEIIPRGFQTPKSRSDFTTYKDFVVENESLRFRVARELFGREWDFFFVLFSGSDWISHRAFAEMLSGEGPKAKGAREYFEKLDGWIGWFFENSGPDTLKMIISDHGFRVRKGNLSINRWLEQRGLLEYKMGLDDLGLDQEKPAVRHTAADRAQLKPSVARLRDSVSGSRMTSWIMPYLKKAFEKPGKLRRMVANDFTVDFSGSRAIGTVDGIYVKKHNDNDQGIVDELIKGMNDFNDKYHVFQQAVRREDVYWGPTVETAPDIVLLGADYVPSKDKTAEVFIERPIPGHDKDGIWFLSGPGGVAGTRFNASLMDISPTILDWMEVKPPFRPDGNSLLERLEPE